MEFFDSHSHLNDEKFDKDKDETINMLKKRKLQDLLHVAMI